jgi:hypothetical protein
MAKLFNLVGMTTATAGTGTMTLGSAISGYLTPALAGVADGDVVSYAINDGAGSEVGIGTYTASGTTLSRTVRKSTNSNAAISLSGAALVYITPAAEDLRWRLSANTTFNVATTGSDTTGDGSSGNPWATLQHAIDFVSNNVDLNGFAVQINVAAGTYAGFTASGAWVGAITGGSVNPPVTLNGDTTTPANVTINGTCIVTFCCAIGVQGFTFTGSTGINTSRYSLIQITGNCTFAGTNAVHMQIGRFGTVVVAAGYTIAGTTPSSHWVVVNNGVLIVNGGLTLTLSGTPAFSNGFINASKCATTNTAGITFAGTGATGARYAVSTNAVVDTGGGGANYFPGSVAGSTATGGQYT